MEKDDEKYPQGHFLGMWMGIGVALFSGIGVPLSIALKNPGLLGIGPALGIAFGLSLGQSIESKYKKEGKIRPLTEDEKKKRRRLVIAGICVLIFWVLIFLSILFS
jgi:hypothetical protein